MESGSQKLVLEGPQRSVILFIYSIYIFVESLFISGTVLGAGEAMTRIVKSPVFRETKTTEKVANESTGK